MFYEIFVILSYVTSRSHVEEGLLLIFFLQILAEAVVGKEEEDDETT